jgi:hypothetical protein
MARHIRVPAHRHNGLLHAVAVPPPTMKSHPAEHAHHEAGHHGGGLREALHQIPGHHMLVLTLRDRTRDSLANMPRRQREKARRHQKDRVKRVKATNKALMRGTHRGRKPVASTPTFRKAR